LTRKANTVSGETYDMTTVPYPNRVPNKMAREGTPLRLSLASPRGASPRPVRANSMRDDA